MSLHDPMLRRLRSLLLSSGLLCGLLLASGQAQVPTTITPDGTLGTAVTQSGTVHDITGGTRPGNGPNLFHSFDRFTVGTNDTARFRGPTGIVNILSRVTGGQQSVIDGRLQSTIPGANLYLLNPSGVLFGPSAILDVSGSFHVSTADVLRFTDGATFSTRIGETSTLTTAPPAAFGFLGPTPAPITVQGSDLQVLPGQTLAVVGGDIQISGGRLSAPSGQVHLASVASAGDVVPGATGESPALRVDTFQRLGEITITQGAVDTSGLGPPGSGGPGGTVLIRSGRLLLDQSFILAETLGSVDGAKQGLDIAVAEDIRHTRAGLLSAASGAAGNAGDIKIAARSLHIDGALITAGTFGAGSAGAVAVEVGTLTLTNGGQLNSSTFGPGRGGSVTVTATEAVTLQGTTPDSGTPSGIFANARGVGEQAGNAGVVVVQAPRVSLTQGAQIGSNSAGAGHGGTIAVTATEAVSLTENAQINATGNGSGTVRIGGGRLTVADASITAFTVDRDGATRGIDLHLSEDVVLDNSGIFAGSAGQGNAGEIFIETGTLTLRRGAMIASLARDAGKGGDITVSARESVLISGRNDQGISSLIATFAATEPGRLSLSAPSVTIADGVVGTPSLAVGGFVGGRAGDIVVKADHLTLSGVGGILSGTLTDSDGGSITIETGRLTVSEGAQIFASSGLRDPATGTLIAGRGAAGNVTVMASESVTLAGQNSRLSSDTLGSGQAGVISLSTPNLRSDGAQISSSTSGSGAGGNVVVHVGTLTLTEGARISSSTSGLGAGGSVMVTATDTLTLAGTTPTGISGIFATTEGTDMGAGAAGNIVVNAPHVTMDAGTINASTSGTGRAGNIDVQVGRLTLTGGADISTSTFGAGRGGNVTVRATESIAITGGSVDNQPGLKSVANATGDAGNVFVSVPILTITDHGIILARTLGDSNAGDIDVRVSRLTLTGGGQIFNGTGDGRGGGNPEGSGRGGNQTVMATDSIFIAGQSHEGFPSGLFSGAQIGSGRAGNLAISTPTLTMMDGGQISTSTSTRGHGGDLRVTATEAIVVSGRGSELPQTGLFSVANASGDAGSLFVSAPRLAVAGGRLLTRTLGDSNAGDLEVQVGSLTLSEGGQIFSGTGFFSDSGVVGTGGPGRGGNLTVRATDSISIAGSDRQGFPSGLFSSAQIGSGRAGNLSVSTPLLTLTNGGLIAADTLSTSSGDAGTIEVRAGQLTLSGGAQISSSTFSSGRGGDVTVAATDHIALSSGGTISASSSGPGDAGDIVIQAGQLFQSRNGAVTTEAEQADGGNIQLSVGSLVELRDSQITATVKTGVGKGGNITIDPQFVILQGSQVRADAFGGPGGNVRIVAGVFLADPASIVSASSALGINGVVNIQAPVTSISGAVAPLPQEFAPISELARDRCAGRLREGRVSRLVLGGRDGVPSEPGSLLLSPLIQMDPRADGEQTETPARTGQVQERARYVLAGTLEGLEAECARWTGQNSPTVRNKR